MLRSACPVAQANSLRQRRKSTKTLLTACGLNRVGIEPVFRVARIIPAYAKPVTSRSGIKLPDLRNATWRRAVICRSP